MEKIVKAKIKDLQEITRLNKQFSLDIPDFCWDNEKWISPEIRKGNYYVLVEDNLTLGAMNIKKYKKEHHILTIAIDKEMHGKSLGRKLIEFAKENAIKAKVEKLTVNSFVDYNLDAFYTKCGFNKESELGKYGGYPYFKFFMQL